MTTRRSTRDILSWGNLLDHEPTDIARQATSLFDRSKAKLSAGSGHVINGITGNDRGLACLCLFLTKARTASTERKAIETSLQRQSGVAPRIFSIAAKQLSNLILGTNDKATTRIQRTPIKNEAPSNTQEESSKNTGTRRRREPTYEDVDDAQDILNWGTLLESEVGEVKIEARRLFDQVNQILRKPGHKIVGLDGNRRAIACVALYLTKTSGGRILTAQAKKDLYILSGVTNTIFSNATAQLASLLTLGTTSPAKPNTRSTTQDLGQTDSPSGSTSKRKRGSTDEQRAQALDGLMRPSSSKRIHFSDSVSTEPNPKSIFSPTSSKHSQTGPSTPKSRLNPSPLRPSASRTRMLEKTPLNLPIKKPPLQPMCIFESKPIINPRRPKAPKPEFDDWNWRSELYHHNWDSTDLRKWDQWNRS